MVLRTIDLNGWFVLEISHGEQTKERTEAIGFELNNLSDMDTPDEFKIPNETLFVMSMNDARELHAWLGQVLVNSRINNL